MKKFLDLIADEMKAAFAGCGYEESYAKVVLSNRPDLCEYQCNGAMAAAKAYKKKPIDIASDVVAKLKEQCSVRAAAGETPVFLDEDVNAVMPVSYTHLNVHTAMHRIQR